MKKFQQLPTRNILGILVSVLSIFNLNAQDQLSIKDITVFNEPAEEMMRDYLTNLVDRQFFVRDSLLSTLRSAKDWDARSQAIRDSMISWTGPFPERTSLNGRITGRLERKEYVVEKILFESRPNFLVSANLYLPKNFPFPRPAILNVTGHNNDGKASEKTQQICIAQAKKGFVSLAIDGLGQGERQIYNVPVGIAHQIIGTQAFISGTHVFNFMVWDAIRAIDFLVSRDEVDAQKIGITGSSGGGMMSTYILPFDDRIAVAIPACNPNTWNYRVHANLATDHEQIFFGAFASSIDPRGDPLFAQVPKPLLINATADDELNPPRGVWDLSTWLYKSYAAHGTPEKFSTSMVKAAHEYNQEQREISYAWMLRWIGDNPEDFLEENASIEKDKELWATKTGSVYDETESRHPHEWVLDYLSEHRPKLESINTQKALKIHKVEIANSIEKVLNTNFNNIAVIGEFGEARVAGDISIRTFVLEPEAGIMLPGILLKSKVNNPQQDVILYIDQSGKSGILKDMDVVEQLLKEGYRICAVDLRGIGETSPDLKDKFWDFLAGKPIFGQRVQDILATTKWLQESEIKAKNIKLWATGTAALYGAFVGVLNDDISTFILEKPLLSFENVVQVSVPEYRNEVMLPGILEKFDMPQVYQALSPRSVVVLNPHLADRTFAGESDIEKIDKLVSTTFKEMKIKKEWHIAKVDEQERKTTIIDSLTDD
ncbi:MAG: acetylxylan esterase [Cyclobacteriaceae bacterium]|nr:acetylxylan esterase [Cyclobacteriaceae bacterium]